MSTSCAPNSCHCTNLGNEVGLFSLNTITGDLTLKLTGEKAMHYDAGATSAPTPAPTNTPTNMPTNTPTYKPTSPSRHHGDGLNAGTIAGIVVGVVAAVALAAGGGFWYWKKRQEGYYGLDGRLDLGHKSLISLIPEEEEQRQYAHAQARGPSWNSGW